MTVRIDPFTQEIIHEALISVVGEMRVTLLRTSFSSIIYEGQDFSCALADREGRLAVQSREDFPGHVGPLNVLVPLAVQKFAGDIHPDDVIVSNDPYGAGTHLNDVAVICPIFSGEDLLMFACSRVHWGDIGGMTPGSLSGQTRDILQEGVRIPILKLYDRGKVNQAAYDLLFNNVRQREDREGDLKSQLAAAKSGSDRVLRLVDRFGVDLIATCVTRILDNSEARMCLRIEQLRNGTYVYKDYLDSDGQSGEPIPIAVKVEIRDRSIEVDFEGAAPQRGGPTNASLAVTSTAVFVAMKTLLDPGGHINEGAFRPFTVRAPTGSLLDAVYPAPMGGFVEVMRRVESALMGAMGQCIPDRVAGDTKGCANHLYISHSGDRGVSSIHYEYPAGGIGAFQGGDGSNAVREFDAGDFSSIHSAEIVELEHPCRIEECSLRVDSGGAGKWRGGLGMKRVVHVLGEEARLSVLSDRNVIPPFGVSGGAPGLPNAFHVIRDGERIGISTLPGKVTGFPLRAGDRVVALTAGGGGFGDPMERSREAVEQDLVAGYVSVDAAARSYGVLNSAGRTARKGAGGDATAHCRIVHDGSTASMEYFVANSASADAMALRGGSILEVFEKSGAPLRGVLVIDDALPAGVIGISKLAARILRCMEGSELRLRRIGTLP